MTYFRQTKNQAKQKRVPRFRLWKTAVYFPIFLFVWVLLSSGRVWHANADQAARVEVTEREVSMQHWRLSRWQNGQAVCDLYLEHPNSPDLDEVYEICGYDTYVAWANTPACSGAANGNTTQCSGLFLKYAGTERVVLKEEVELPELSMRVDALNCAAGDWCDERLSLKFSGEEPLEGYQVTQIHVQIGGRERTCKADSCEFRMPVTGEQGVWVEYWADSSYGDQSDHSWVRLRNVEEDDLYRVDILGDEWVDSAPAASVTWNLFPAIGHSMSEFLAQPLTSDFLMTTKRYAFLSGNLIRWGYVDASTCPAGGLLSNGNANECGEQVSASLVLSWQNRYDEAIYDSAQKFNVPARAIKGIIAQESQFWPFSTSKYELGLGNITDNGADMLLNWDVDYYLDVCQPVLGVVRCSSGFGSLTSIEQEWLRGLTLSRVGTDAEVDLIAASLQASSMQTSQLVKNITGYDPWTVTSYEDMWSLTIGNYYAGAGCIANGLETTWAQEKPLKWENITKNFLGDCTGAENYVNQVMILSQ